MITGKEPYNAQPMTVDIKDNLNYMLVPQDIEDYPNQLQGIPIGLEIMSRYIAAIIQREGVPSFAGKETTFKARINLIEIAKELTDLTLKVWNDENK